MANRGPGPLAVVHRILIWTALGATIGFAAYEIAAFVRTREASALLGAAVGVAAAIGFAVYLRSLRGLAAKLTPRSATTAKLLVPLALALATRAHGGAITIETTLKTDVGPSVVVTVTVRNSGSDVAHDVRPRLRFNGQEQTGFLLRDLPPGKTHQWRIEFPPPTGRGRYPLLASVGYADPGFRGFSAVSATLVDFGGVFPARLRGGISRLAIDADATLQVTVANDDTVARKVRVGVFLPDELGGYREVGVREIGAGKADTIPVPVRNHGALAGSRYPVYGVLHIEGAEAPSAALISSLIDVVASVAVDWQTYLPRAAMVLAGLFALTELTLALLAWRRPAPPRTAPRRA